MRPARGTHKRVWIPLLFMAFALSLPSGARADSGAFNVELDIGGAALATDTAASDVKRFGMDLSVKADYPVPSFPLLAPQLAYAFEYLPGKSGVHSVMAGLRARILDDDSGFGLSPLWPGGAPKGSFHGNFYVEGNLGYVYAPTVGGDNNWFGFSLGLGYQMALSSPLHLGAYVRYQHVVFKEAKDPVFITFGISIAFGYPKKMPKVQKKEKKEEPPEKMAEPTLEGKPGDKDGDGVGDATDLCPISAPNIEIDKKGCMALRGKMIFQDVLFSKGGLGLSGEALLRLKRLADVLKANSQVYVQVSVFADDAKSASGNNALADKRAEKIKKYLVKYGVQQVRIRATGSPPAPPPPGQPKTPWWDHRVEFSFRMNSFQ